MAQAFTCFEKFGAACEMLAEDDRRLMVYAIGSYGMFGEEPDLPYPLDVIFSLMKDDIDNSKASRAKGARGGRPRGPRHEVGGECAEASREVRDEVREGVSHDEKPGVSDDGKPGVSDSGKQGVSDGEAHGFSQDGKPNQAKPIQTKPVQAKERRGAQARFRAPTQAEVEAFAAEAGIGLDAGAFCDFYASKGWKVGSSPMRDWRAAARNWARCDAGGGGRAGSRREVSAGDEYSRL